MSDSTFLIVPLYTVKSAHNTTCPSHSQILGADLSSVRFQLPREQNQFDSAALPHWWLLIAQSVMTVLFSLELLPQSLNPVPRDH